MIRFFRPCGTAGGTNNRPTNTPEIVVERLGIHHGVLEPPEDCVERVVFAPVVEMILNGLPFAEPLWQVTPGGSGTQNPEDTVEDRATVLGRSSGWFPFRDNQIRHQLPLIVR